MMKKIAFLSASVMSVLFASQAFASNNTITFQGRVDSQTCTVTVNGNTAKPTVLLPTVNVDALKESGSTAGQTTFDIGITGCNDSDTATTVSTLFNGNSVSAKGNLSNVAAADEAAQNVEIQILNTKGGAIDFNLGQFNGEGDLLLAAGEKDASATYTAQYYATQAASAGAVEASLQYAVSYN
ncbi:type 1 fimbrial protein [Pantoea sp. EKM101V]|nr:fimbrial protein [Pantoea sp. EKM101V]KAF6661929.1 type 1 fimbrial protein [Pantoea sp. EKM101V]